MNDDLLTLAEAAEISGRPLRAFYNAIHRGHLSVTRSRRRVSVTRAELDRYLTTLSTPESRAPAVDPPPDDADYLTLREAACIADVTASTLRNAIADGRLRAVRAAGPTTWRWMTTRVWLNDYVDARRGGRKVHTPAEHRLRRLVLLGIVLACEPATIAELAEKLETTQAQIWRDIAALERAGFSFDWADDRLSLQ